jgi:GDP/UDP-N,N'-diacetylbacillosamine 2-epimerase (hydrolysing)
MKKICVFTGTRADYGLLKPLLDEIEQDQDLQLQLLVSGTHLAPEFGNTVQLIREDGFHIDAAVAVLSVDDSDLGTCRAISTGVAEYALALKQLQPDIMVLLGDRFEAFAAATAALVCRIPLAHLHGGETTEGACDEAFRHAISKMSSLHFTATEEYRRRVIQLGEQPDRAFTVGAIGLHYLKSTALLSRDELATALDFDLNRTTALITFHPATLDAIPPEHQFKELLAALDEIDALSLIFTKANADPGGRAINRLIDAYVVKRPGRAIASASLGHLRYLSALACCDLVVGNSSSGLIEAPSFGTPTVNIGDRQKGRIRASSVIDCPADKGAIVTACRRALTPGFQDRAKGVANPYYQAGTAKKIKEIIKDTEISSMQKTFYDLPEGRESHSHEEP